MGTILPEQIKSTSLSPQQQHTEIIHQTNETAFDALKNYPDECRHIEYFINAVDGDEGNLGRGEQYLRLTLSSMSGEFQTFLETFHVNWELIFDYLQNNLYYKVLEELVKIPDFTNLVKEKLQAI